MGYKDKTDEELVFEAGRAREIDSASVEMMRRLKDEIKKFNENSSRYSKINIIISLVLFFVIFMQLIIMIQSSGFNPWIQVILLIFLSISIWYLFNNLTKKLLK